MKRHTDRQTVLDNVQTAVFKSAKSVQYVQIAHFGRKQTSRIVQGTSDFRGHTAIIRMTADRHTPPQGEGVQQHRHHSSQSVTAVSIR